MAITPHSNQSIDAPARVVISAQVNNSVFSIAVSIGELHIKWPPRFTVALGLVAALAWLAPESAHAVNKCTGADGKVVYRDTPCAGDGKSETIKVYADKPSGGDAKQLHFKPISIDRVEVNRVAKADVDLAKRRLKDPDSAKFDEVKVFRFEALGVTYTMTCGELNARNSYGGYVGSKPFWVYDGIFTQTFDHFLPTGNLKWLMGSSQTACLKDGLQAK